MYAFTNQCKILFNHNPDIKIINQVNDSWFLKKNKKRKIMDSFYWF